VCQYQESCHHGGRCKLFHFTPAELQEAAAAAMRGGPATLELTSGPLQAQQQQPQKQPQPQRWPRGSRLYILWDYENCSLSNNLDAGDVLDHLRQCIFDNTHPTAERCEIKVIVVAKESALPARVKRSLDAANVTIINVPSDKPGMRQLHTTALRIRQLTNETARWSTCVEAL